ncbi:MAG TPA: hypothetical protein VLS90_10415 [Thermodesulfobacteriota bacterium]|nr:hypothetical protein [Thermodesulfobacteriota bacterium]
MSLKEGKKIKNILTGRSYEVKRINREWVLLQAEDGLSQVLTGKMGLKFMYSWEGSEEDTTGLPLPYSKFGHSPSEARS